MVYRRSRRSWRRRRFGRKSMASKRRGRAFVKRVKKIVYATAEKKIQSLDVGTLFSSVSVTPAEQALGQMAQGASSVTRVGRKIAIHSFVFRGTLVAGVTGLATTDDGYNRFRIVLGLYDGDFTLPLNTLGVAVDTPFNKTLYGTDHLLKKYWDKHVILNTHADLDGTGALPYPRIIHKVIKFKRPIIITTRDDTSFTPDKHLYLSMVSDSSALPNPGFLSGAYAYIRYTDV